VADIPFADDTFDVVAGVQTFEHWAEESLGRQLKHEAGLSEAWRVLKPGGLLYLDAPIHLHGHEMFIAGDVDRIRRLFDEKLWQPVVLEKWRQDYWPLERYVTPEPDRSAWAKVVTSYSTALLEDIVARGSVHLLTIRATKREDGSQRREVSAPDGGVYQREVWERGKYQ
jgi:SAM-dependent methyltransferase